MTVCFFIGCSGWGSLFGFAPLSNTGTPCLFVKIFSSLFKDIFFIILSLKPCGRLQCDILPICLPCSLFPKSLV
jgi:hypothetical protein